MKYSFRQIWTSVDDRTIRQPTQIHPVRYLVATLENGYGDRVIVGFLQVSCVRQRADGSVME